MVGNEDYNWFSGEFRRLSTLYKEARFLNNFERAREIFDEMYELFLKNYQLHLDMIRVSDEIIKKYEDRNPKLRRIANEFTRRMSSNIEEIVRMSKKFLSEQAFAIPERKDS